MTSKGGVNGYFGTGTGASAPAEHARLHVVREAPEPSARSQRPSRRAIFRALVKNATTDRGRSAEPVTDDAEAPPVTLTSVTEVVPLPGGQEGDCYRVTLDVRSSRTEPVTLDVVGLEVGDTSLWSLPRQPTVEPGVQRLTLVAGGAVGEGRLTLKYELDGHRHQVSTTLPSRSA